MKKYLVRPKKLVKLSSFDPDDCGGYKCEEEAEARLIELRQELAELQGLLYADNQHALLVILQGMDASGKDGTIRHVMNGITPLGCRVTAFRAPSEEERDHDFLWRIYKVLPRYGEIGIFNRSHYEDVLVVRVRQLAPEPVWRGRFKQINRFEQILSKNNIVILKFFLHISKEEQKKRFKERLDNPKKYWKFCESDIEDRRYWDDYQRAYEDVLNKCSTKWAPWTVVPANNKWYRNLIVAETIVRKLRSLKMKFPEATFDRSKIVLE